MFENVPTKSGQPSAPKEPKDWGPWKPVDKPEYNPPDTKDEISSVLSKYTSTKPPEGDDSVGSSRRFILVLAVLLVLIGVGVGVWLTVRNARKNTNANTANANTTSLNGNQNVNVNASLSNVFENAPLANVNPIVIFNENTNTVTTGNLNVSTNVNGSQQCLAPTTTVIEDPDRDGLTDEQEKTYKTDPRNADTDGDGYCDGLEVQGGFNPKGPGTLNQNVNQ